MSNPYYTATDSIVPFTRANASVLQGEFVKLEQAFDEVNAEFSVNRQAATSTSSVAIGTGSKTFLATTGRGFSPGQFVMVASTVSVSNYMFGQITSYDTDTGSLTINVLTVFGSGTYSAWAISLTAGTTENAVFSGQLLIGIASSAYKADINGTMRVAGAVTLASTLNVAGNTDVGGDLDVTGSAALGVTTVAGSVSAAVSTGSISPITGSSTVASLPSGSFSNSGSGSSVFGITSSISSGGNNTSSWHFAGITQSVALWYLYGNGSSSYTSDYRTKKNIKPARDGYLDDLMALEVVKFDRRTPEEIDLDAVGPVWMHQDGDSEPKEIGLLAQDVAQVFPGLVEDALHDLDGNIYEIDEDGQPLCDEEGNPIFSTKTKSKILKAEVIYGPIMLKALQEANAKINALAARVAQLEG